MTEKFEKCLIFSVILGLLETQVSEPMAPPKSGPGRLICGHTTTAGWPYVDQAPGLGVPFPLAGLLGGFRIPRISSVAESRRVVPFRPGRSRC